MNYKKRLEGKIDKARKLIEDFKQNGVCAELDEKTGEITIRGSEFNKTENRHDGVQTVPASQSPAPKPPPRQY